MHVCVRRAFNDLHHLCNEASIPAKVIMEANAMSTESLSLGHTAVMLIERVLTQPPGELCAHLDLVQRL